MIKIKAGDRIDVNLDWIPYKNRWNHYVFTDKNFPKDMSWPGFKNAKGLHPEKKNGEWVWVADKT